MLVLADILGARTLEITVIEDAEHPELRQPPGAPYRVAAARHHKHARLAIPRLHGGLPGPEVAPRRALGRVPQTGEEQAWLDLVADEGAQPVAAAEHPIGVERELVGLGVATPEGGVEGDLLAKASEIVVEEL